MKKKSILIVNDFPDFLDILDNFLSEEFTVYRAKNGIEALNIIKKNRLALIISDNIMPEMSGEILLEKVLANIKTRMIPYIFLTSHSSIDSREEALIKGADDFIAIPYDWKFLYNRIKLLIERYEFLMKKNLIVTK